MMNIRTEQDGHDRSLFPRVHLSGTKVPGPRAPPRNKMALFEQFTIPPHHFVPPLVQENSCKVSLSSGSGLKQANLEQLRSKASEMSCVEAKCEAVSCSVAEFCFDSETSKPPVACDSAEKAYSILHTEHANEFPPGPYINKRLHQSKGESVIACNTNVIDSCTIIEKHHSTVGQLAVSFVERMSSLPYGWSGMEAGDTDRLHVLDGEATRSFLNHPAGRSSTLQEKDALMAKTPAAIEILRGHSANNTNSLMQQIVCSGRRSEVAGSSRPHKHPVSPNNCNMDRSSSNFMPRIIPKHVIGVIGQREFWEARKTMLLQQKTLSMQVFELHRVIEVQRLIAAMPGLLLGGKGNCAVVEGSVQPDLVGVSIKEAKHSAKQNQALEKGRKQPRRSIWGGGVSTVNDQCQKASVQMLLLSSPPHFSFDQSRGGSWNFIRTPCVRNQSLIAGPHVHGLWRAPIAFSPCLTSGQWWGGHQAMVGRPSNFPQTEIPVVCNRPLPSHQFVNGNFMDQQGPFPGPLAPWIPQSSYSSVSPLPVYEFSKPSRKPQQAARSIGRKPSSDCKMMKSVGDLCLPEKATCVSNTESARVSNGGNKEISATESCTARTNDALLFFPGDKRGVPSSIVIRAVPHPASRTLQAAAQILKSIQQSESSNGLVC